MARVSFGSRAGSASDYLVGNHGEFAFRQSSLNGVYTSLQDLCDALKAEIIACGSSELPELTTCELSIRDDATLPLVRPAIGPYSDGGEHDLPVEFKTVWMGEDEEYPGINGILPKARISTVLATGEGQPRQIVQRAASRAIVQAIESTDGFKYSFNNAWAAKDDGGLRFSYICQDSMQNKDRHANGFTKTQKHLKGEGERGPRKPTYDCKGSISVKFSAVRKSVDIYYRHYAIHTSVADRKPPPRPAPKPKPSKERVSGGAPVKLRVEEDTGGLLGTLRAEESAYSQPSGMQPPPHPEASNISRPLKRKRTSDMGPPPRKDPNRPLSLVELLTQSEDAKSPTRKEPSPKQPRASYRPPPVEYSLPSWQASPPSPPAPPVPPQQQQQQNRNESTWTPTTYAPPYQPQAYSTQPQARIQPYPQPQGYTTTQSTAVPIPRDPKQLPPKYQYQGTPSSLAPKAQGLFSTLKPVRKEELTSYEPHFVIYSGSRAKTSCHNCRISKKKCDEGRPMCGACARTGKLDCVYETAPTNKPATMYQPDSSSTPTQSTPSQSMPPQTPTQTSQQQYASQAAHTQPSMSTQSSSQYATPQSGMSSQTMGHSQSQSQSQAQGQHKFQTQPQLQFQTPYQGQYQMQTPQQHVGGTGGTGGRGGSPDPWFPRR